MCSCDQKEREEGDGKIEEGDRKREREERKTERERQKERETERDRGELPLVICLLFRETLCVETVIKSVG